MDRIKYEKGFIMFKLNIHKWDWIIKLELQESFERDMILCFFSTMDGEIHHLKIIESCSLCKGEI
jgi:hypothetical protein